MDLMHFGIALREGKWQVFCRTDQGVCLLTKHETEEEAVGGCRTALLQLIKLTTVHFLIIKLPLLALWEHLSCPLG